MQKNLLITILLFLIAQNVLTQDKVSDSTSSLTSEYTKDMNASIQSETNIEASKNVAESQEADVYFGSTEITIENGDYKKIEFYGTFVSDNSSCAYSRCFYGWINNYTVLGEETVIGYNNESLLIKPVFEFKTNSEEDFVIVRNQNLDETWVQMIEILCEKINPQMNKLNVGSDISLASGVNQKFQTASPSNLDDLSQSLPTSNEILQPESISIPKYSFQTIQDSDMIGLRYFNLKDLGSKGNAWSFNDLQIGDKISSTSQKVPLETLKASTSSYKQTVVLNKENLIKNRALEYQVKLGSTGTFTEKGLKVPDFQANVQVNFKHTQKTKVELSQQQVVKKLLSVKNTESYDLKDISERRAKMGEIMDPKFNVIIDEGPTFEDAQILDLTNQKYSGVNVVEQFNGANSEINNQIMTETSVRKLQTVQNYTVYNYRKTLFSQNIFGRTFMAAFDLQCYMLVYSNDQKLQCTGTFVYELFGNQRTIPVFNFIRSVSYAWSWSNQYRGNWGFNVYISLPPPVSFIGLTFRFNVNYVIDVNVNFNAGGTNPYQVSVNCLATTRVDTDASAGVRVVAIEGGAFITGTLVNAGTDPRVALSYYFNQRYINVMARWDFWVNAFRYNWGFYYRTYSFWSGWSSRRVINQWTINGVYGRWVIVNRNWNIYI